jgi:hypothetical protein
MRFLRRRTTKPSPEPSRAREPVTWGEVEAAERAVARRFLIYVAVVATAIALLFGWSWWESLPHG